MEYISVALNLSDWVMVRGTHKIENGKQVHLDIKKILKLHIEFQYLKARVDSQILFIYEQIIES